MNKNVKENSFDGAPGGSAGSLAYQGTVGSYSSPSNYQDAGRYDHSSLNKAYNNDTTGQSDTQIGDNSGSFDKDVEKLFRGKQKPTIDDVLAGMQYELQHMVKKDKHIAKQRVIENLKKYGPKYYTGLHMLNINDKDMDSPMAERVNVLNQMIAEKAERRKDLQLNDAIKDILNQKREEKIAKADCLISLTRK